MTKTASERGSPDADFTTALLEFDGSERAADRLFPLVYRELRRLAESHLRHESPDFTLQATELVHEAYLRLVDQTRARWENRSHFFAIAAQAIRRVLVDHARSRRRLKRGGGGERVALDRAPDLAAEVPGAGGQVELLELDLALRKLAETHPEQARVVEVRFFGGLEVEETAAALGLSKRTVERYWTYARSWLYRELHPADDDRSPEP